MNIQQTGIWEMIGQEVKIRQKTVTCAPLQKLQDAFTNIMAGGEGTVDVKGRVKSDVGLSAAFGRQGCTEESGVSTALNACQAWNVAQMRRAMAAIYQRYGGGHGHDDGRSLQLLDIEMSGMPARRKGEGSTRGYFPRQKNKRGQEVGEAGIIIDRSRHNVVGPGNAIAYNLLDGISFWGHTPYNTVTKNSIHDNGGRCIEIRAPDQSMPSRRRPSTSTFRWAQFPASPCKRHSWPVGEWLPVPAPGSYFRLTVDPAWLQNRYAGHPFRPYRFGVWREGL